MATLEAEFTTTAIAELVRESCDKFYGDDTILTDWVVEEFIKRLEKALAGKVLVEVEGAQTTDEPCLPGCTTAEMCGARVKLHVMECPNLEKAKVAGQGAEA